MVAGPGRAPHEGEKMSGTRLATLAMTPPVMVVVVVGRVAWGGPHWIEALNLAVHA